MVKTTSQVIRMCGETPDVGDRVVGDTINAFLEESLLSEFGLLRII